VLTQALDVANTTLTRRIIGLGGNIDQTITTVKGIENEGIRNYAMSTKENPSHTK
jgi:hypothetical protein